MGDDQVEDGFNPRGIEPLGGVWIVHIAPDGTVLGPTAEFNMVVGYAVRENGRWRQISAAEAQERRINA